jgi:1-aminocyclopropane-1-carboxylate deaminase
VAQPAERASLRVRSNDPLTECQLMAPAAERGRRIRTRLERDLRDDEIALDDRYHAGTYGIPDASTLDAMRLAARLEAMISDPVYEGKSMAGLIDLVSRGEIDRSSTVLHAHLGGQPAVNAYAALFD